jgi:hypothetical protein
MILMTGLDDDDVRDDDDDGKCMIVMAVRSAGLLQGTPVPIWTTLTIVCGDDRIERENGMTSFDYVSFSMPAGGTRWIA